MDRASALALALAAAVGCLLSACGGGGGSDGASHEPSNETTAAFETQSIEVAATPADSHATGVIHFSLTNVPADGLYVTWQFTTQSIVSLELFDGDAGDEQLRVLLRDPVNVEAGTYTDSVTVKVCYDEPCAREVHGSPVTIPLTYTVTTPTSASIDTANVNVAGHVLDDGGPQQRAIITVTGAVAPGPFLVMKRTSNGIAIAGIGSLQASEQLIDIGFRNPSLLGAGEYDDTIDVRVCYDSNCYRQVSGSPFRITTTYKVSSDALPEEGLPPLQVMSRHPLAHDVIDAEYSKALESIVTVSAVPSNALYVYHPADDTETAVALSEKPTAVSIAPDGSSAAVGHDGKISVVDLLAAGQAGAAAPEMLDVSADVFDLVLDGRGFVHAFPERDQWVFVHSIELATHAETIGSRQIYEGTRARLHPDGISLYLADSRSTPSRLEKHDVSGGPAQYRYGMADPNGDACGNVWMGEAGDRLYSACGQVFTSSATQADDMLAAGTLQISDSDPHSFLEKFEAVALSESAAAHEILMLEADPYECRYGTGRYCYSHLARFESATLDRSSLYTLPGIEVSGHTYWQRGQFIFHSADGAHRYLLSRADESPDPLAEYFVSELE